MGRRGPKPLPKALKLLRHPVPVTRHPAAIVCDDPPTMPDGLSRDEEACWQGLVAEMATVPGLLARADRGALELAARLEPAMRAAAVVVRAKGSTVECFDQHGHLKFCQQRPEAGFYLKAVVTLKSLYAELGLTPSGRSRVSLTPAAAPSKLDAFLGKGGSKRGA